MLINLLDPNDQQHTDTIRLTALGVLTAALSSCFPTPAPASTTNQSSSTHSLTQFPSLLSLLADRACRHLFLLARTEAPALRLAALKAIAVLFEVGRGSLKLQRELFLSFLVARLEPIGPVNDGKQGVGGKQGPGIDTPNSIARPGTPSLATPRTPALGTPKTGAVAGGVDPALRELMLETLVLLSREPSFMVDLWANYDCDVNCEDIFERLIGFLTKVSSENILKDSRLVDSFLCRLLEYLSVAGWRWGTTAIRIKVDLLRPTACICRPNACEGRESGCEFYPSYPAHIAVFMITPLL